MSQVKIQGNASGTGIFTVAAPNSNTDRTLTLPQADATLAINGPAFSAFRGSSHQTISSSTWTKVQLNNEIFDTNNCFDPSTNYRFTPNVAGYYQVNYSVYAGNGSNQAVIAAVYKNGSAYAQYEQYSSSSGSLDDWSAGNSTLVYLNGSTDYIELYAYIVGSAVVNYNAPATYMDGYLARTA